jgi:hypothetical protein
MADPRAFFLSLTADGTQEIPAGYLAEHFTEIPDVKYATEVAPGVRAILLYTGGSVLPDGSIGHGATIAVWSDT